MGNGLTPATVNKATTPSGGLALGAVAGVPVTVFGGMVAYLTMENLGMNGWLGPTGMASTVGTIATVAVASRLTRNRAERREIERRHQLWVEFRAQFPPEAWYALDVLCDPFQASQMWQHPQVAIGLPANPNAFFPGTFPTITEGQDPGFAPDPGVRESPVGARIRLTLPQGFSADHVRARLDTIASSLSVPKVGVAAALGNTVSIELRVRNPLAATVPFPEPEPSPVPLKALRVAMREDGKYFRLRLWNNHLFLAGVTGSGKSGVLWSTIGALAPDIKTGRVQLHVIDLKRGSEMSAGYRLFESWAWLVSDAIKLLLARVKEMRERLDERREHAMRTGEPIRNHEATVGDPHHVILVDEIIALIELVGDVKADLEVPQIDGTFKEENIRVDKYIKQLLMELLSQSRAAGYTLIVATQNAAKAIFDLLRDMFPVVIGMRQASPQQTQMVFGTGAAERGVDATSITVDEAGTAYIDAPEEGGMAQRIRYFRVHDSDITNLINTYGRPADSPHLPSLPLGEDTEAEGGNVVTLRREQPQEEPPLLEKLDQLPLERPGRCGFCGTELEQIPGGRPAKFCRNTDHRQQYHRLKKRLASGD